MLAPWGDRSCSRGRRRGCLIEQRNLTSNAVPLGGGGCSQRLIDAGKKFSAIAAKKVKSAAFDQAFQHFAIANAFAFAYEDGDFFGVIDLIAEQPGHELHWIVRLQICGVITDQAVGGAVALVKSVTGEFFE